MRTIIIQKVTASKNQFTQISYLIKLGPVPLYTAMITQGVLMKNITVADTKL